MKRTGEYNTRQGEAILDYMISQRGEHITAHQIGVRFKDEISLATVYRQLDNLVKRGKVHKFTLDGISGACYQVVGEKDCSAHTHLKCEECGEVIHLDCSVMNDIPKHIFEEHSFVINPMKTVLYGKCFECQEGSCE